MRIAAYIIVAAGALAQAVALTQAAVMLRYVQEFGPLIMATLSPAAAYLAVKLSEGNSRCCISAHFGARLMLLLACVDALDLTATWAVVYLCGAGAVAAVEAVWLLPESGKHLSP